MANDPGSSTTFEAPLLARLSGLGAASRAADRVDQIVRRSTSGSSAPGAGVASSSGTGSGGSAGAGAETLTIVELVVSWRTPAGQSAYAGAPTTVAGALTLAHERGVVLAARDGRSPVAEAARPARAVALRRASATGAQKESRHDAAFLVRGSREQRASAEALLPGHRGSSGFVLGGADRYEAEAEQNERRLFDWLTAPNTPERPASLVFSRGSDGAMLAPPRGPDTRGGSTAPLDFGATIRQSRGAPLAPGVRASMESLFRHDFSGVQVHTDGAASRAASSINALAFTVGRDVYFGSGRYDPDSPTGLALLGHELTHVAQGGGGRKVRASGTGTATHHAPAAKKHPGHHAGKKVPPKKPVEQAPPGPRPGSPEALAGLSDADFWRIVGNWGPTPFSQWIFDGSAVKNPILHARFCEVYDRIGPKTMPVDGTYVYGWEGAVRLGVLEAEAGASARVEPGKPEEKKGEETGKSEEEQQREREEHREKLLKNVAAIGDNRANKIKRDLLTTEAWEKAKEIREAYHLWTRTSKLKGMTDLEFWEVVSEFDAKTWRARVIDGDVIKDPELFKRFETFFGRRVAKKMVFNKAQARKLGQLFEHEKAAQKAAHAAGSAETANHAAEAARVAKGTHAAETAHEGVTLEKLVMGEHVRYMKARLEALEEAKRLHPPAPKPAGLLKRLLNKLVDAGSYLFEKFESIGSRMGHWMLDKLGPEKAHWLKNIFYGEECGVFTKILPQMKAMIVGIKEMSGIKWLIETGRSIGRFFKPFVEMVKPLAKWLGILAPFAALAGDVAAWMLGPRELAEERAKDDPVLKAQLEDDRKGRSMCDFFYGVAIGTDILSCAGTLVAEFTPPPVDAFGLAATLAGDGLNLIWTGYSAPDKIGIGRFSFHTPHFLKKLATGAGLPILSWAVSHLMRKKRGSSALDDDDPELGARYEKVLKKYGGEPGDSLDILTKYRLEKILGRELGEVRLHSGPLAGELARETEAEALTVGRDIYMPSGRLDLASPAGLGLLVHEATHVAQNAPASPSASPRSLGGGSSGEVMEDVAHAIEARFVASARASGFSVAPMAEPVFREAPAPAVAFEAPAAPSPAPAFLPAASPGPSGDAAPSRKVRRSSHGSHDHASSVGLDPVSNVMVSHRVSQSVSQEEFLDMCTDRILELMRDELRLDSERRESLSWNADSPSA